MAKIHEVKIRFLQGTEWEGPLYDAYVIQHRFRPFRNLNIPALPAPAYHFHFKKKQPFQEAI